VALAEQRASELSTSILAVNVMVGVGEVAAIDGVAHSFALIDGINKTES